MQTQNKKKRKSNPRLQNCYNQKQHVFYVKYSVQTSFSKVIVMFGYLCITKNPHLEALKQVLIMKGNKSFH